jgi:hypothetical protein
MRDIVFGANSGSISRPAATTWLTKTTQSRSVSSSRYQSARTLVRRLQSARRVVFPWPASATISTSREWIFAAIQSRRRCRSSVSSGRSGGWTFPI